MTLQAYHLAKSFGRRHAVRDVSLQVEPGEVIGLLGPNGAGKTTSFYMMVGLIRVDKGKITIDDKDISRLPMHARAQLGIGYLPQEASVFRKLTVAENIKAILQLHPQFTPGQNDAYLEELLAEFHIDHIRDSLGLSLSGGERRRVEIARALATKPRFMLLDEPFAGVDPISVIDIKNIICQLSEKNIGVLITDHNVRETLDICSRAYIVNEGIVMAEGTTEQVLSHKQVREVYLGDNFCL